VTLTVSRYERLETLPWPELRERLDRYEQYVAAGWLDFEDRLLAAVEETERRLRTGVLT
jgi:hypothetical protein